MSDSPRIRRRLAELTGRPLNYDPESLDLAHPPPGWLVDDRRQPLPPEPPGPPAPDGSWAIARRLIRGYEFADPSIVRAHYDSSHPLEGRNMLLELRALGLARIYVGVRVCEVYEGARELDEGAVHVFGWSYRTLQGHVEEGQMNWEVWKRPETGAVEFHVHAVSRPAPITNPFVRLGFRVLRVHERRVFLESTCRRMRRFTELALERPDRAAAIESASSELTARRAAAADESHAALGRKLEE